MRSEGASAADDGGGGVAFVLLLLALAPGGGPRGGTGNGDGRKAFDVGATEAGGGTDGRISIVQVYVLLSNTCAECSLLL